MYRLFNHTLNRIVSSGMLLSPSKRVLNPRSIPSSSSTSMPVESVNDDGVVVLGTGNMARGMVEGLLEEGFDPKNITFSSPNTKRVELKVKGESFVFPVMSDNLAAVKKGRIVVFAFKPFQALEAISKIVAELNGKLLISPMAGVRIGTIEQLLGENQALIARNMPNMAVSIGEGAGGYYIDPGVVLSETQNQVLENIMNAFGCPIKLNREDKLDKVTATSGSGIAYFFLLFSSILKAYPNNTAIDISNSKHVNYNFGDTASILNGITATEIIRLFSQYMKFTARTLGLNQTETNQLVDQTLSGAIKLFNSKLMLNPIIVNGEVDPVATAVVLAQSVRSARGTTGMALDSFDNSNIEDIVSRLLQDIPRKKYETSSLLLKTSVERAMSAACSRSAEMGDEAEAELNCYLSNLSDCEPTSPSVKIGRDM
jgi:pyrroline-5-carboxylate reductase